MNAYALKQARWQKRNAQPVDLKELSRMVEQAHKHSQRMAKAGFKNEASQGRYADIAGTLSMMTGKYGASVRRMGAIRKLSTVDQAILYAKLQKYNDSKPSVAKKAREITALGAELGLTKAEALENSSILEDVDDNVEAMMWDMWRAAGSSEFDSESTKQAVADFHDQGITAKDIKAKYIQILLRHKSAIEAEGLTLYDVMLAVENPGNRSNMQGQANPKGDRAEDLAKALGLEGYEEIKEEFLRFKK